MQNLRLCAPALAALLSFGAGCDSDDGGIDATLTVVNESDYVIERLYLTEVDNPDWGPNLLAGDFLLPDEELTLGVQCDYYDALLIDEDGVECELEAIDLCLNDAVWYIRNNTCVAFEAQAREAGNGSATEAATTGSAAQAQ